MQILSPRFSVLHTEVCVLVSMIISGLGFANVANHLVYYTLFFCFYPIDCLRHILIGTCNSFCDVSVIVLYILAVIGYALGIELNMTSVCVHDYSTPCGCLEIIQFIGVS